MIKSFRKVVLKAVLADTLFPVACVALVTVFTYAAWVAYLDRMSFVTRRAWCEKTCTPDHVLVCERFIAGGPDGMPVLPHWMVLCDDDGIGTKTVLTVEQ